MGSTGYGAHGDYLFGWEGDSLQRAMDNLNTNCWSETCPELKLQSWEKVNACTKRQQVVEDISPNTCTFVRYPFLMLNLTNTVVLIGLKEIPGNVMVK